MCINKFYSIIPFLCFILSFLFFKTLENKFHFFLKINEFAINKNINLIFFRTIILLLLVVVFITIIYYINLSELITISLINIFTSSFIVFDNSYKLNS